MSRKRSVRRARAVRNARARERDAAASSAGATAATAATPTPAGRPAVATAPETVVHVGSAAQAVELAERLRSAPPRWPVVVVTTPARRAQPYVPVEDLLTEVRGIAEVVVLRTGEPSWAFSRSMPPLTQVFGGASRVYAPDRSWLANPYSSPLRFAYAADDGPRNVDLLAGDAFAFAPRDDAVGADERPAAGTVLGAVASRGLVTLDDGSQATVWAELTVAGVAIDRLVRKDQRVEGILDPTSRRLDVRGMLAAAAEPPAPPRDLTHVLARVERVSEDGVEIALRPGQGVEVPWERVGDATVRDFYQPGDVVAATWWRDGAEPELRLDVWSEGDPVADAPAVLPGGPPWLEPGDLTGTEPVAADEEQEPHPGEHDETESVEAVELRRAVAQQRTEIDRLRRQIKELRRRARAAGGRRQHLWGAERFELDVYREWRRRFAEAGHPPPMRPLELGPGFLDSLEQVEGMARTKVVAVVVEVLTGLAAGLDGRDLHQLRTGPGGDDPYLVRADGAKAWRAALQRGTASARRLHYWALPNGTIELSRVVTHDDTAP